MAGRGRGRPPVEFQNQIPAVLFKDAGFKTLNAHQRLLLIAMIATADRMGRGLASASHLWADAFVGLGVTVEQTEKMIQELPRLMAGSKFELRLYTVDRNQYYYFPRWREFQKGYEVKTSRYPDPPDAEASESGTGAEPPTQPEAQPDGSADLPPDSGAATVPTRGETPAEEPRAEGPDHPHESADLSAVDRARRSPEYREYEEVCRDGELDRWLAPLAFDQLFGELVRKGIRDWTVLIEVAREAARSAGGRPPNVRYGIRIIQELPEHVQTREQARAWFERPRDKPGPRGQQSKLSSNVLLRREKKDDSHYEYLYASFSRLADRS